MKKGKTSAKEKKNEKFVKEIESALSKRAEDFVFNEIKKELAQNPGLMNQLSQAAEGISGKSIEAD